MSKENNKSNSSTSLLNAHPKTRALLAVYFTLFLMFLSAIVAYVYGYTAGFVTRNNQPMTASVTQSEKVKVNSEAADLLNVIYYRIGKIQSLTDATITVNDNQGSFQVQINDETSLVIGQTMEEIESGLPPTAIKLTDLKIGDEIAAHADTNIYQQAKFTASLIEKF